MVNGYEYAFEDLRIEMFGRELIGFQGVNYTTSKLHENIHGRRNKPVKKKRGKKDYSGSITLLQSELEAFQRMVPPGKDLTDAEARITVAYAPEGGVPTVDILKECRFAELAKGMTTEEPTMTIEIPFVPFDIKYNA